MSSSGFPDTMDFLLVQICHLHYSRTRQLFEALGLYRGQPPVLRILWEKEGIKQTELADRLNITPATLTRMLQRMEKAGFLQRRPDAEDQRVSRVYLTEAGRSVQTQVEEVWKTMEAETFSGFTLEEKVLLKRFLLQMRENLLKATGDIFWK